MANDDIGPLHGKSFRELEEEAKLPEKWKVEDYEYPTVTDTPMTWNELWQFRCGKFKYMGQFWEWLKENYHPPIKKI